MYCTCTVHVLYMCCSKEHYVQSVFVSVGTGNVLKIQSLLHLCSEYFGDKEDETVEPGEGGEKGSEGNKKGTETGGECGHRALLTSNIRSFISSIVQ